MILLAVVLYQLLHKFPYPYENIPITSLSEVSRSLLPPFPVYWDVEKAKRGIVFNSLIQQHGIRLFEDQGIKGVESVSRTSSSSLLLLDKYGNVYISDEGTQKVTRLPTYVGPGRPLGYHYHQHEGGGGVLYICNSLTGLLSVNFDEKFSSSSTIMLSSNNITYANDLDVSIDGTSIYFTSATAAPVILNAVEGFYDTMRGCLLNMLSGDLSGRLLRYDIHTGETQLIADGLWFANGVALSHNEDYVLVVETMGFRVLKHWLKGPKAGTSETIINNLPGFPDGISKTTDGSGAYWLCLVSPISPLIAALKMGSFVRYLLAPILTSDLRKLFLKKFSVVLKIDGNGKVLQTLMDPDGTLTSTTSAATQSADGNHLYLGNLEGDFITSVDLRAISGAKNGE